MASPRMTAAHAGRKRYQGAPCKLDAEHGRERYTSSGQCVKCSVRAANQRAEEMRLLLKASVSP